MKPIYKHALIIINPISGIENREKKIETIISRARELGWNGEYELTKKNENASKLVKKAAKKSVKHFIVCGGDGTIMETVAAIANTSLSIGIIPQGTGNILAQNLHIPLSVEKSLEIALHGRSTKIDIGCINNHFFTIMAGIGFDAEMIKLANRKLKKKFGFFAYIYAGIKSILEKSNIYSVKIDNQPPRSIRAKGILIANLGKIQGGITVVPKSNANNGVLRIGIIQSKNWYFWISLLFHALSGNIQKSKNYTLLKGEHIEIAMEGKQKPYECDGDLFPPAKKLIVDIFPQALTVLIPN